MSTHLRDILNYYHIITLCNGNIVGSTQRIITKLIKSEPGTRCVCSFDVHCTSHCHRELLLSFDFPSFWEPHRQHFLYIIIIQVINSVGCTYIRRQSDIIITTIITITSWLIFLFLWQQQHSLLLLILHLNLPIINPFHHLNNIQPSYQLIYQRNKYCSIKSPLIQSIWWSIWRCYNNNSQF